MRRVVLVACLQRCPPKGASASRQAMKVQTGGQQPCVPFNTNTRCAKNKSPRRNHPTLFYSIRLMKAVLLALLAGRSAEALVAPQAITRLYAPTGTKPTIYRASEVAVQAEPRFRGGSQPLAVVALYYTVGAAAYQFLENWNVVDSLYFLTVTATTVGYGDLAPVTHLGRVFTSIYSILGITIAFDQIVSLVGFMRNGQLRERLLKAFARLPGVRQLLGAAFLSGDVDTDDASLSMRDVNLRISYPRRYALALLGPAIVFLLISLVAALVHKLPPASCSYFGIITMSTIGYGDFGPTTRLGKLLACVYLPLGVTALADALADVAAIRTRRKIREGDYAAIADELLAREAVRHGRNPDESLTEAEFLSACLMANELVDRETVQAIRRQFRHVVRKALPAGQSGDDIIDLPALTPDLVHAELIERGKLNPSVPLDEWKSTAWLTRVNQGEYMPLGSPIDVPRVRYDDDDDAAPVPTSA